MNSSFIDYLLHLADSTLILAQRNSEWCGHGPVLEQDIAITNISLDLLGQARNFYQYAAQIMGGDCDEDQLAYLRKEREFKNLLLVEGPNGDWAQTVLRQNLFSQFQFLLYRQLEQHPDQQVAAIAKKSIKETAYHLRWSSEWVIRLGDGTDESHRRLVDALTECWSYTGELFMPATYESENGIAIGQLQPEWLEKLENIFEKATITAEFAGVKVGKKFMHTGGKQGLHTEHLGYILAELQYVQRTYPNSQW